MDAVHQLFEEFPGAFMSTLHVPPGNRWGFICFLFSCLQTSLSWILLFHFFLFFLHLKIICRIVIVFFLLFFDILLGFDNNFLFAGHLEALLMRWVDLSLHMFEQSSVSSVSDSAFRFLQCFFIYLFVLDWFLEILWFVLGPSIL